MAGARGGGGGGAVLRDFVFVKMRQADVEFIKSALLHLRDQAQQGSGPLPPPPPPFSVA